MLICFVARQFDCCSEGCPAASCQDHHHTAVETAPCRSGCAHHHVDEMADQDEVDHSEQNAPDQGHSHPHHLCVASHLVYTNTQRGATSAPADMHHLALDLPMQL